jgi:hypothetical protein
MERGRWEGQNFQLGSSAPGRRRRRWIIVAREREHSSNLAGALQCAENMSVMLWCVLWAKGTISSAFFTAVIGKTLTALDWNEVCGSLLMVNWNSCNGSTACHVTKWSDWRVMQHVTQDNILTTGGHLLADPYPIIPDTSSCVRNVVWPLLRQQCVDQSHLTHMHTGD